MNRIRERLSELRDKGRITPEQYDELMSTLEGSEPEPPAAPAAPEQPTVLQTTTRKLTVRLISEDLSVRGVEGLTAVRIINGQSSVRTRQNGDVTEMESTLTGEELHGFSFHIGASGEDVELEVPTDMPCELKTVSGDITLEDMRGLVSVHSVSGDIDGRSLDHIESATSTSGDLDLERCIVEGDVVTKSGDIDVTDCTIRGMLKSYSGDVGAADTVLDDVDVLSFSGDVELDRTTVRNGARLKTTSGDIRASLAQHDVVVDVDTRSGDASIQGPGVDIQTSRQRIPVGAATVELSARTGSGNIEIRLA